MTEWWVEQEKVTSGAVRIWVVDWIAGTREEAEIYLAKKVLEDGAVRRIRKYEKDRWGGLWTAS